MPDFPVIDFTRPPRLLRSAETGAETEFFATFTLSVPDAEFRSIHTSTLREKVAAIPGVRLGPGTLLIPGRGRPPIAMDGTGPDYVFDLSVEAAPYFLASSFVSVNLLTVYPEGPITRHRVPVIPAWDTPASLVATTTPPETLLRSAPAVILGRRRARPAPDQLIPPDGFEPADDPSRHGVVLWSPGTDPTDAGVEPMVFDGVEYRRPLRPEGTLGALQKQPGFVWGGLRDGDHLQLVHGPMRFTVTAKTGDVDGAGTDANITLRLSGRASDNQLQTYPVTATVNPLIRGDAFEQGRTDVFDIEFNPLPSPHAFVWPFGEVERIHLTSDGRLPGAAWFLDGINILHREPWFDQRTVSFPVHRWIGEGTIELKPGG